MRELPRPTETKHGDRDAERSDRRGVQAKLGIGDDTVIRIEDRFEVFMDVNAVDSYD